MSRPILLGENAIDAELLAGLCRRYSVRELSIFGSAARGEMNPESDIDVMVEFAPGSRIGVIQFDLLAEELASIAGRRVDLVTKQGLKPWLRDGVLRDARLLYAA
jgi:predicted nucleotidyltransferase